MRSYSKGSRCGKERQSLKSSTLSIRQLSEESNETHSVLPSLCNRVVSFARLLKPLMASCEGFFWVCECCPRLLPASFDGPAREAERHAHSWDCREKSKLESCKEGAAAIMIAYRSDDEGACSLTCVKADFVDHASENSNLMGMRCISRQQQDNTAGDPQDLQMRRCRSEVLPQTRRLRQLSLQSSLESTPASRRIAPGAGG